MLFALLFMSLSVHAAEATHELRSENEPRFNELLAKWDDFCSKALAQFNGLSREEAGRLFISDKSPLNLNAFSDSEELKALENASQPLLQRWVAIEDENRLNNADKAALGQLIRHGLMPQQTEGMPYLLPDMSFFGLKISGKFDEGMREYVKVKAVQPTVLFDDEAFIYTLREMGGWAVSWERFLKKHRSGPSHDAGLKEYRIYMDCLMFSDLANSRAFETPEKGKMARMPREWQETLAALVRIFPNTATAKLLAGYLADLKKVDFTEDKPTIERYKQLLEAAFVSTPG